MKNKLYILILSHYLILINLTAQTPGTKIWEFGTGGAVTSSPAIGIDKTIYVGSEDSKLYAVNPDGTKKWEFATGGGIQSSPAIGKEGVVYVGSSDCKLYAINPNGTKKWEFLTGNIIYSSPSISADGTIYISSYDGKLYAINPNGTKKWEFFTGGYYSSPAIGTYGTIYLASDDKKIYAVDPEGNKDWDFATGGNSNAFSSPVIGNDGTIYVGLDNFKLYAINPDGSKKWEFAALLYIISSPAIGNDGTIYVGSDDRKLYAINPDGSKKWEFVTGDYVESSPAIGKDGTIFIGSYYWDKKLYAINPDGTKKWEFLTGGSVHSSPAIGIDGTVFVGSADGKLYAVASDCGGPAIGNWSRYRNNNSNDGNGETGFYTNNHFTALITALDNSSFELNFNKISSPMTDITITGIEFDNQSYKTSISLPFTVRSYLTSFKIPVLISNSKTGLYESDYKITYSLRRNPMTQITLVYSDAIEAAVIEDNDTEMSFTGRRAIDAFNSSLNSNLIAALNNKGVIYRLIGDYNKAEKHFALAVNLALNNFYGFTGIKMNQGVVKSDKLNSTNAMSIYSNALEDLTAADSSVLTPQLYYNQAWEHYKLKAFSDSKAKALLTINHKKTNSFLRAKAYVLLGADDAALKDTLAAIAGFQNAIDIDPSSCIAEIARENIRLLTTTDIFPVRSASFITYPNPSSGDFQILLRDNVSWPIIIRIYNQIGILFHEKEYYSPEKMISIQLPGIPKGIYFIEKESGGRKTLNKIVII